MEHGWFRLHKRLTARMKTEVGKEEINGLDQNGEWRVQTPRRLVISVGSHVLLIIWERNLHGRYNPYGKSSSVGAFGHS